MFFLLGFAWTGVEGGGGGGVCDVVWLGVSRPSKVFPLVVVANLAWKVRACSSPFAFMLCIVLY